MQTFELKQHAASLLPDGRQWKLVWNDEFDGDTLDMDKWRFRSHIMGQRFETWTDEAAKLDGAGNLVLSLVEKDGAFYTSQLETGENYMDRPGKQFARFTWPIGKISQPKFQHKYGYYECRCKLQKNPGWWSAFWLQSPQQGSTLDPARSGMEVDIMECFEPGVVCHNIHWNGCGDDWQHVSKEPYRIADTEDGWHRFGLLWSREGYRIYVDGREVWTPVCPVSDTEQFILISCEVKGYRDAGAKPSEEVLHSAPDCFTVDYIRVFDEV